jgi:hypothetical protein
MDVPVLRLIGQHALQEAKKVLPLLVLGEFRVNLASIDFEGVSQTDPLPACGNFCK